MLRGNGPVGLDEHCVNFAHSRQCFDFFACLCPALDSTFANNCGAAAACVHRVINVFRFQSCVELFNEGRNKRIVCFDSNISPPFDFVCIFLASFIIKPQTHTAGRLKIAQLVFQRHSDRGCAQILAGRIAGHSCDCICAIRIHRLAIFTFKRIPDKNIWLGDSSHIIAFLAGALNFEGNPAAIRIRLLGLDLHNARNSLIALRRKNRYALRPTKGAQG